MTRREQELTQSLRAAKTAVAKREAALALADLADDALRRSDAVGHAAFASLLCTLQGLLRDDSWGVRSAAATTVGLIALSLEQRAANVQNGRDGSPLYLLWQSGAGSDSAHLAFDLFDMARVVERGQPLVAHGPERYSALAQSSKLSPAQRLLLQRAEALRVIGHEAETSQETDEGAGDARVSLRVAAGLGAVIAESDVDAANGANASAAAWTDGGEVSAASAVTGAAASDAISAQQPNSSVSDVDSSPYSASFSSLMRGLACDLLHPHWEARHGAAAALREVMLRTASANPAHDTSSRTIVGDANTARDGLAAAASASNCYTPYGSLPLQDVCLRCMAVLALDRFADYGGGSGGKSHDSSTSAAPVRETVAQTLALAIRHLIAAGIDFVVRSLLELASYVSSNGMSGSPSSPPSTTSATSAPSFSGATPRPLEWSIAVRHGAMLGLQAVTAVLIGSGAGTLHSSTQSKLRQRIAAECLSALRISGGSYATLAAQARKAASSDSNASNSSSLLNVGATEEVIGCAATALALVIAHKADAASASGLDALSCALDCLEALPTSSSASYSSSLAAPLLELADVSLSRLGASTSVGDRGLILCIFPLLPRVLLACCRLVRHPSSSVRLRSVRTIERVLDCVAAQSSGPIVDVKTAESKAASKPQPAVDSAQQIDGVEVWWLRQGLPIAIRSLWRGIVLEPPRQGVAPVASSTTDNCASSEQAAGEAAEALPATVADVLACADSPYVSWTASISGNERVDQASCADSAAVYEEACFAGIRSAMCLLRALLVTNSTASAVGNLTSWPWLAAAATALTTADGEVVTGPAVAEPLMVQAPTATGAAASTGQPSSTDAASSSATHSAAAGNGADTKVSDTTGSARQRAVKGKKQGKVPRRSAKQATVSAWKAAQDKRDAVGKSARGKAASEVDDNMIGEEDLSDLSDYEDGAAAANELTTAVDSLTYDVITRYHLWDFQCAPVVTQPLASAGSGSGDTSDAATVQAAQLQYSGMTFQKRASGAAALAVILAGLEEASCKFDVKAAGPASTASSSASTASSSALTASSSASPVVAQLITSLLAAAAAGRSDYWCLLAACQIGTAYIKVQQGRGLHLPSFEPVCRAILGCFPTSVDDPTVAKQARPSPPPLLAYWSLTPATAPPRLPSPPAFGSSLRKVWGAAADAHAALCAAASTAQALRDAASSVTSASSIAGTRHGRVKAAPDPAPTAAEPLCPSLHTWTTASSSSGCFAGIGSPSGPTPPSQQPLWGTLHLANQLVEACQAATASFSNATAAGSSSGGTSRASSAKLAEISALAEEATHFVQQLKGEIAAASAVWADIRGRACGAIAAAGAAVVAAAEGSAAGVSPYLLAQSASLKLTPIIMALSDAASVSGNGSGSGQNPLWAQTYAANALAQLLLFLQKQASPSALHRLSVPPARKGYKSTFDRLLDSLLQQLGSDSADVTRGAVLVLQCYLRHTGGDSVKSVGDTVVAKMLRNCSSTTRQLDGGSGASDSASTQSWQSGSASVSVTSALNTAAVLLAGLSVNDLREPRASADSLSSSATRLLRHGMSQLSAAAAPPSSSAESLRAACNALLQSSLTHDVSLWCELLHACLLPALTPSQSARSVETALGLLSECLSDVSRTTRLLPAVPVAGTAVDAATSSTSSSAPPASQSILWLPLEVVVGRVSPLLFPAILPLLNHSSSTIRRQAASTFRTVVRLLPLVDQRTSAGSRSDPLLASLSGPLLQARQRGMSLVRTCSAGAVASLSRLPISVATTVGPSPAELQPVPSSAASAQSSSPSSASADDADVSSPPCEHQHNLPSFIRSLPLRPYQRQGVAWLDFLRRCHMGGAACDDMGLGKSLQALCALALAVCDGGGGREDTSGTSIPDSGGAGDGPASSRDSDSVIVNPSLPPCSVIVCPPSITHHWVGEVRRFFGEATVALPAASATPSVAAQQDSTADATSAAAATSSAFPVAAGVTSLPLFGTVVYSGSPTERANAAASIRSHLAAFRA